MPRLIKKWIVDTVEDRDWDLKIPVSVDPKNGGFWAEYPEGETIDGDTKEECRRRVKDAIRGHNMLDWVQFIAVKTDTDRYDRYTSRPQAYVGISQLIRYERARIERRKPHRWNAGEYVVEVIYRYRPFGHTDKKHIPHQVEPRGKAVVFLYDEELWQKLKEVALAIKAIRISLNNVMQQGEDEEPEDVKARIMALGKPRLPMIQGPVAAPEPERVVIDATTRKAPPPPPRKP